MVGTHRLKAELKLSVRVVEVNDSRVKFEVTRAYFASMGEITRSKREGDGLSSKSSVGSPLEGLQFPSSP